MANTLLNIQMITNEALRILKNELVFTNKINKQYDDQFAKKGAKIGASLNIRKPVRYTVSDGPALSLQDVTDQQTTLTLDKQKHVDFSFSSQEMTLNIDMFSDRYLKPAVASLANQVDLDGLQEYKKVANSTGTPGTDPNAFSILTDAGTKLSDAAAPVDMRHIVFNPAGSGSMADALKGLFQSQERIKEQYEKGLMGIAGGFDIGMDQNVVRHTVGAYNGTPLVDGAAQTGSSLVTDGWSSSTLVEGDVFTIDGVFSVNPQSRQSTGVLQEFVVTADVTDTAGAKTISISPAITPSGQYQTVSNSPADNAPITVRGTASTQYAQNLAFHKDAFVLGCADLEMPGGVDMAARASDPDTGLSIRVVRQYSITDDTFPCRLDILYGHQTVYAELANRIWGA